MKILIVNGPNLNLLGTREPEIYGTVSMADFLENLKEKFPEDEILFFQSNVEGEIINRLQEDDYEALIINPAAYTHTSLAIRDALAAVSLPVIEVHISNIARREELRQKSLIAPVTAGQIIGFGPVGYHLAMIGMIQIFEQIKSARAEQKAK